MESLNNALYTRETKRAKTQETLFEKKFKKICSSAKNLTNGLAIYAALRPLDAHPLYAPVYAPNVELVSQHSPSNSTSGSSCSSGSLLQLQASSLSVGFSAAFLSSLVIGHDMARLEPMT